MRVSRMLPLVAILVFAVEIGGRFGVKAQQGCSAQSLFGPYAYSFRGVYIGDAFGDFFDFAATGRFLADGNGGLSGADTVSNDEVITRGRQYTGTYTINSDCTGSVIFKDSAGRTIANMDLVIAGTGNEVDLIESDQGTNIVGTAKQQILGQ